MRMDDDPETADAILELRARRALRELRERHALEPWVSPSSQCRWVVERVAIVNRAGLAVELAAMETKR